SGAGDARRPVREPDAGSLRSRDRATRLKKLHEVANPPRAERAVLVGHAGRDGSALARSLEELALLADTAGARVLDRLEQRRGTVHPATFIGKGKLEELKERVTEREADLVVFN